MSKLTNYLSLIKFSHTIFAMPFAMIGFFLGLTAIDQPLSVIPGWHIPILPDHLVYRNIPLTLPELGIRLLLVILCMIFARSAAMAFNRYLDKNFDAKNPRTAIREIPAGIISSNHALIFVIFNCTAFIAATFF